MRLRAANRCATGTTFDFLIIVCQRPVSPSTDYREGWRKFDVFAKTLVLLGLWGGVWRIGFGIFAK